MLRNDDNETEILLGNKQLLGIFFVVAILLGVAFYGGYIVGKAAPGKKPTATATQDAAVNQTSTATSTGGVTQTVPGDDSSAKAPDPTDATQPVPDTASSEPVLGDDRAKKKKAPEAAPQSAPEVPKPQLRQSRTSGSNFAPEPGQQFLQVAAVGRDEALAVADVLHGKGFPAHAVLIPENPKLYRVLIGPVRDAGELSSTRDALRRNGFREVIVRKY